MIIGRGAPYPLTRFHAYARSLLTGKFFCQIESHWRVSFQPIGSRYITPCYTLPMTTETETTINHRSFSSFASWVRCGKAWQLERGFSVQTEPAWWFVAGSAFHTAVERYLRELHATQKEQ